MALKSYAGIARWRLAAAATIVTLVLLEIGVRISFSNALDNSAVTIERTPDLQKINADDVALMWRVRANVQDFRVRTHEANGQEVPVLREFTVNTNSAALRGKEEYLPTSSQTVLAIGDSTTFGLGVDDSETWPAQLQALLRQASPDAQVLNAGVTGYSLLQSFIYLENHGFGFSPETVVLTCGSNDFDSGGTVTHGQALEFLRRVQPWSTSWVTVEVVRLLLALRDDGSSKVPSVPLPEFEAILGEIASLCDSKGIKLILVIWPWRDQLTGQMRNPILDNYQEAIRRVAKVENSMLVDLRNRWTADMAEHYIDDVHVDEIANADAAKVIAEQLTSDTSAPADGR